MIHKALTWVLVVSFSLALTGCGGGGNSSSSSTSGSSSSSSGGTAKGLTLPSQLSVVLAKDDSTKSADPLKVNWGAYAKRQILSPSSFPSSSAFVNDAARTHVYDPSTEALDTVNMILCMMDQTKASDFVNQGAYTALVNEAKCDSGQNTSAASQGGQNSADNSGANAIKYKKWTVEATRASNSDPEYVKVWVPQGDDGPGGKLPTGYSNMIVVYITVTAGVSSTDPFGQFHLDFKQVTTDPSNNETVTENGFLETVAESSGQPHFRFYDTTPGSVTIPGSSNTYSYTQATNVLLDDASGNSGIARTHFNESYPNGSGGTDTRTNSFAIAFDTNHFYREDASSTQACLSRTNYNTQVWQYNLYYAAAGSNHSQGDAVQLKSGFPFTYDDGAGNVTQGDISYWGVWSEDPNLDLDGKTVKRRDGAMFDITMAPGRLTRRTRQQADLSKLDGAKLQYWGPSDPANPSGTYPNNSGYDSWIVQLSSSDSYSSAFAFKIVAGVKYGNNGPQETPVSPAITIFDQSATSGDTINFWADQLGGDVVFVQNTGVTVPNKKITFFVQDSVMPDDSALTALASGGKVTLNCYNGCPKGGITQQDVDNDTMFYPPQSNVQTPYVYSFDLSTMTLTDKTGQSGDGQIVDLYDGSGNPLNVSGTGAEYGIGSSPMLTDTSGLTNPWDTWGEAITYRWDTGQDDWNKMAIVTPSGGGNALTFDKPLSLQLKDPYDPATDDANGATSDNQPYTAQPLLLQYGGAGQLWGFPWEHDTTNDRWYSPITLKDGVVLTDGQGTDYVVKEMEKEQHMQTQALSNCSTLSLPNNSNLPLPTASDVDTSAVTFGPSDRPVVTDPPAVIGGEEQ